MTALMISAWKGRIGAVKELIAADADVNAKTKWGGYTVLMYAALGGNPEIFNMLIDKGADVQAKAAGGWTTLFSAVKRDNLEIIRLLLQKGLDINAKTENGDTPLSVAREAGRIDVVQYLKEHGAGR
jgi:ankyrin repeat protein